MSLGSGAPANVDWSANAIASLDALDRLEGGSAELRDVALVVTGSTSNEEIAETVRAVLGELNAGADVTAFISGPAEWSARLAGGDLTFSGAIASAEARESLAQIANDFFSAEFTDNSRVGAAGPWSDRMRVVLPHFARFQSGQIDVLVDQIRIRGLAPASALSFLREDMAGFQDNYAIAYDVTETTPEIAEIAGVNLDVADPVELQASCQEGFTQIMSANQILFESASARIDRESGRNARQADRRDAAVFLPAYRGAGPHRRHRPRQRKPRVIIGAGKCSAHLLHRQRHSSRATERCWVWRRATGRFQSERRRSRAEPQDRVSSFQCRGRTMTWLLAHMWLALLSAAFFGGLLGWAFRHWWKRDAAAESVSSSTAVAGIASEGGARLLELETQLAAERDEVASLRGRLDGQAGFVTPDAEPEEGSTEWRNRYLESRVRFLEKQLADAEEKIAAPPEPAASEEDDDTKLVWRNRYLEGRVRYLEEELAKGGSLTLATPQPAPAKSTQSAGEKPDTLDAPRAGKADNLKQIGGIGPKIERLLNDLGIYHFDQIAGWSEREIAWVNAEISFKGRIERENWVSQATSLAKGLEPQGKGS